MKLISKFHDYYDTPFRQSAVDPKHLFKRETTEMLINFSGSRYVFRTLKIDSTMKYFSAGCIGFCGKLYPFIKYHELGKPDEYSYSVEELEKKYSKQLPNPSKSSYYNSLNLRPWLSNGSIKDWKEEYILHNDKILLNIFDKYKTAYFVIDPTLGDNYAYYKNPKFPIILYPRLKDYQFFKVFDTYQTFQCIEQFLTNNLVKPDMIEIKIPDKLKAESKGFDKWSFRKMSGKH